MQSDGGRNKWMSLPQPGKPSSSIFVLKAINQSFAAFEKSPFEADPVKAAAEVKAAADAEAAATAGGQRCSWSGDEIFAKAKKDSLKPGKFEWGSIISAADLIVLTG